jgi:HAMP domain-containing protein
MTKYEYLFDANDKLVNHSEAIRLNEYRLYPGEPLDYIYKQGDEREYFAKKIESNNDFAFIGVKQSGSYGESPEHYNAKMKIVHEKKYFDTIFNQWIEFDNVVPEFYHDIKKRPDLSCYDANNKLVCCIEICYTNAKTEIDIEKLKQLKVPIIEIDIKNDNRCKHLILPTLLEANRQEFEKLSSEYKIAKSEEQTDLSERINQAVKRETQFDDDPATELRELEKQYNRLADELRQGLSGITTDVKYFEINFKSEVKRRFDKIDKWLQTRLQRYGVEADSEQKIKTIERDIKRIENEGEKRDYRIGKLESEVKSVESKINQNRNTFDKIAKQSKIEWFRNSWMNYEPQNIVEEIKYWIS